MHKTFILALLLFFYCLSANAQSDKQLLYPVAEIDSTLKLNANAVVRLDSTYIEIKDKEFVLHHKKVITILNENGLDYGVLRESYNSFRKITKTSGRVYSDSGKPMADFSNKQVHDVSAFGNVAAFQLDDRVKLYRFKYKEYPFTVVLEVESRYKSLFFLPNWMPQFSKNFAVEKAFLTMKVKEGFLINSVAYNFNESNSKPYILKEEGNDRIHIWELRNLPAFKSESLLPMFYGILPHVKLAASTFELNSYKGSAVSWNDFGKFIYDLNTDKDELPVAIKDSVLLITRNCNTIKEKVDTLYRFLQNNTRYLLNSKGILSWQTISAADVAKTGYGDCKGLTNYLKAMLKSVNITAYQTLIFAGDQHFGDLSNSFVKNSFNHVILCVPDATDTILLECTSSSLPMGYLSEDTRNRQALMLTENGGVVISVPSNNKNSLVRNYYLTLNPSQKEQKLKSETEYCGLFMEPIVGIFKSGNKKDTEALLKKVSPFKVVNIDNSNYQILNEQIGYPKIVETNTQEVTSVFNQTSKRYLATIPVNIPLLTEGLSLTSRTHPFYLPVQYTIKNKYTIEIPNGLVLEQLVDPVNLKEDFGRLKIDSKIDDNKLVLEIDVDIKRGVFNKDLYSSYITFENVINRYNKSGFNISLLKVDVK